MPARLPLLKLPLLILLLALSALLLAAANSYAAAPVASSSAPFVESLIEGEGEEDETEGGEEESECEAAEEEVETGEMTQAEAKEICTEEAAEASKKKIGAAEECVLRSAHGQAITSGQGDKLKLTIGYTTYEPATATLEIGQLDTVRRHLGRSGVLHLVESLHGHDGPKRLSVRIDIVSAKSAGCPFRQFVLFPR